MVLYEGLHSTAEGEDRAEGPERRNEILYQPSCRSLTTVGHRHQQCGFGLFPDPTGAMVPRGSDQIHTHVAVISDGEFAQPCTWLTGHKSIPAAHAPSFPYTTMTSLYSSRYRNVATPPIIFLHDQLANTLELVLSSLPMMSLDDIALVKARLGEADVLIQDKLVELVKAGRFGICCCRCLLNSWF